jgi:hypothetical protein
MSRAASPRRYPHFIVPEEIHLVDRDDDRKWPWRDALLLLAGLCLMACAGIGLALAS